MRWARGLAAVEGELVLVLGAGQVLYPDAVEKASSRFWDAAVACVQLRNDYANADALTTVFQGRNEQDILNEVIGPSLGARGQALWLGAGSLVRREAFEQVAGADRPGAASRAYRTTARLLAAGWRVEFERTPMVESMGPDTLEEYLEGSRRRAYWTLRLLATRDNPLLQRGVPWRARLTLFAGASRYLSGLQRALAIAVLLATLVTGRAPVGGSLGLVLGAWVAVYAAHAAAVVALGRGTLAFGDRSRQALRTLGPYLDAALRAFVLHRWVGRSRSGATGRVRDIARMRVLTALVLALDGLLALRAVGDRYDVLPAASETVRAASFVLGVLLLLQVLDVMQLLVRRRQQRRFYRCAVALPAWIGVEPAKARDLTPAGIRLELGGIQFELPGNQGARSRQVGDRLDLELELPTPGGPPQHVPLRAIVRNRADAGERIVLGVELDDGDVASLDEVKTYYWAVRPWRVARGDVADEAEWIEVDAPAARVATAPARLVLRTGS
ncbi:MAG: glycosyltransferase family 2 protein, partial [Thermoleophilia bacterium]